MKKILAVLLVALPLTAQVRENVTVTAVEVPVTVVDRSGQAVRGLTQRDFELVIDGKKTPITGFETIDLSVIEEQTPLATPLPKAAYRNFLLVFDFSGSAPGAIARAQKAASEFVSKQMKRRDLCAIATFDVEKGTQVLTSFTSDREFLQHVIEDIVKPEPVRVADPLRLGMSPRTGPVPQTGRGRNSELAREKAEFKRESEREIAQSFNQRAEQAHNEHLRGRIATELRDLGKLARLLDRVPGQKQVILLSEGFDDSLVQGKELAEGSKTISARDTDDTQQNIDRGEIWKVTSEERFGSSQASFEIREMALLFRRSDVLLHAIDIRGLRTDVDIAEGLRKVSNEGLHLITRPTGGSVFENATDLRRSFDELLRQQDYVYILVFEAKPGLSPGAFHEIKVKVPAARGGRVTHRAGFYESSPVPESQFEQTLSLAGMLLTEPDRNDVPLTITAFPLPAQRSVPLVIEIDGDALVRHGADEVVTADLYVYAFDAQNRVGDYVQQRLAVDLVRNADRLRAGGLRYVSSLELAPGAWVVKALVRVDESGQIGLTRRVVEVSDAPTSATFLHAVQNGINVAAPGRSEPAVMAFSTPQQRYLPVAGPSVHGTVTLAVFGTFDATGARFGGQAAGLKPALQVLESAEDRQLVELDASGLKAGEYTLLLEGLSLPFHVE